MTKGIILGFSVLFVMSFFSCKDKSNNPEQNAQKEPVDLLPRSGEISGWSKGSSEGDFKEATDETSLYEILDGGASDYIDHGFVMGVSQIYNGALAGAAVELEVRIFDHGSANGSKTIYDYRANTEMYGATPTTEFGSKGRINLSLLTDITADFWKDNFYVYVAVNKEQDEAAALNTVKSFAINVSRKIGQ